jgi:hypothetical protein
MKKNIVISIDALKAYAKEHGLTVRFRDKKTDQGDFCIFIYDKNFRESYAVGYDGTYNSQYGCTLDDCIKSAYKWIDKRDKRFIFRDGKWQYGRYHFILWKDKKSWDKEHYLTAEDADTAAAAYVVQGYAVVCYLTSPTDNSYELFKTYGDVAGNGK